MNKIWEIGKAWKNVFMGSDEVKALAEERMKICNECEFKKHMDLINADVCGVCHCVLKAKVHSPVDSCPKGKWPK